MSNEEIMLGAAMLCISFVSVVFCLCNFSGRKD